MSKRKYLEVVAFDGDRVVKRLDMTRKPERHVDKVDDGMNINLDHENYFTRIKEYDSEQPQRPDQP